MTTGTCRHRILGVLWRGTHMNILLSRKSTPAVKRSIPATTYRTRLVFFMACAVVSCSSLLALPISTPNSLSNTTLIDFNNLVGGNCNLCGTAVTNQYSNIGVTFANPSYSGQDAADNNLTSYVPGAS